MQRTLDPVGSRLTFVSEDESNESNDRGQLCLIYFVLARTYP